MEAPTPLAAQWEPPPVPTFPQVEVDWHAAGYRYRATLSPVGRWEEPPVPTMQFPPQEAVWGGRSSSSGEPPPAASVDPWQPIGPGSYRRPSAHDPVTVREAEDFDWDDAELVEDEWEELEEPEVQYTVLSSAARRSALDQLRRRAVLDMRLWRWY